MLVRGRTGVAVRGACVECGGAEAASAVDAVVFAGRHADRIRPRAPPVVGTVVAVEAPLPDVPVHLVQAEGTRGERSDGSMAQPPIVEVRPVRDLGPGRSRPLR